MVSTQYHRLGCTAIPAQLGMQVGPNGAVWGMQVSSTDKTGTPPGMSFAPLAVHSLRGVHPSSTVTGRPLMDLPDANVFCLVLAVFLQVDGGSVVSGALLAALFLILWLLLGERGGRRGESLPWLLHPPLGLTRLNDTCFTPMSWYSIPILSPVPINGRGYGGLALGWDSSLAAPWPDTTTGLTLGLASVLLLGRLRSPASLLAQYSHGLGVISSRLPAFSACSPHHVRFSTARLLAFAV